MVLGGVPTPTRDSPLSARAREHTGAPPALPGPLAAPGALEPAPASRGTPVPSAWHRGALGEPRALFALPSARGPSPAPRWPIECEVIKETIEHIGEGALRPFPPSPLRRTPAMPTAPISVCPLPPEWVPPKPEPFCQPTGHEWPSATLGEEQGTIVYHLSPGSGEQAAPPGAPSVSPSPHRRPSGLPPHSAPRLLLHPCSGRGGPGPPLLAGGPLGGSSGHHAALRIPLREWQPPESCQGVREGPGGEVGGQQQGQEPECGPSRHAGAPMSTC